MRLITKFVIHIFHAIDDCTAYIKFMSKLGTIKTIRIYINLSQLQIIKGKINLFEIAFMLKKSIKIL